METVYMGSGSLKGKVWLTRFLYLLVYVLGPIETEEPVGPSELAPGVLSTLDLGRSASNFRMRSSSSLSGNLHQVVFIFLVVIIIICFEFDPNIFFSVFFSCIGEIY